MASSRFWPRILLVVLVGLGGFFRFYKLSSIKDFIFDEEYFAVFAQDYLTFAECPEFMVAGGYPRDTGCYDVHPPMGKLLIAAGQRFFPLTNFRNCRGIQKTNSNAPLACRFTATNVMGWRFMPAVFGTALIVLMYLLGAALFKNEWWGVTAAGLAAFDNMLTAHTRISHVDGFLVFFELCALLCTLYGIKSRDRRHRLGWFGAAAIAAAAAVSVKLAGLAVVGVIGIVLLYDGLTGFESPGRALRTWMAMAAIVALFFVLLLHLPEALMGHPFPWDTDLADKVRFHLTITEKPLYTSKWYTWPLSWKPMIYYHRLVPVDGQALKDVVCVNAHGNPVIWWTGSAAILAMMAVLVRSRSLRNRQAEVVILAGLAATWLPWAAINLFTGRESLLHHFFPSVPFLILGAVWAAFHIWSNGRWKKVAVVALGVLAVAAYLFFYPLTAGLKVTHAQYRARLLGQPEKTSVTGTEKGKGPPPGQGMKSPRTGQ